MPYKITIILISEEVKKVQGEWTVVEERPYSQAEFDEANKDWQKRDEAMKTKQIRGYAPDHNVTRIVERQILVQEVDVLNIEAVIKAINNIS